VKEGRAQSASRPDRIHPGRKTRVSQGLLKALGFSQTDCVVVVHVDDMGLSAAANAGAIQALEGAATCGSVMVPAPGFEEIAATARRNPQLDLGVHLTLNAEHERWRWAPVREDVPSLVAPEGGMWRTIEETVLHADPIEVERELRAQIDRALECGIDVTHLDSHMGTVLRLELVDIYFELARAYRLPAFVPRVEPELLPDKLRSGPFHRYVELIERVEADGWPVFDHFDSNSLHFEPGRGREHNRARRERLGISASTRGQRAAFLVRRALGLRRGAGAAPALLAFRSRDPRHAASGRQRRAA